MQSLANPFPLPPCMLTAIIHGIFKEKKKRNKFYFIVTEVEILRALAPTKEENSKTFWFQRIITDLDQQENSRKVKRYRGRKTYKFC